MENLHAGKKSKGDRQIIRFICGGGKELFEPHFTYFGFRYVEVHGLTKKPDAGFITGRVFHTGMSKVGSFTCSNKLINKLVENIQWSQRANIMGIPTDCNQRDERCGYTGDMNFFAPTAVYNFDMSAFLNKWLFDVQDAQQAGGWYADHAPFYGPGRGPNIGWSDAGITTPYQVWRTYGDTRAIRENYTGMKKFLQWFTSNTKDSIFDKTKVGNGDWLNIGGGASKDVIGNAYAANDFKMMAEMAEAIGETADAASFRQQFKVYAQSFAKKFITPEGEIRESSQTGYALAFTMGLIPDSLFEKVSGKFISEIEKKKWHLATGFIGTPRLLPALHLAGRDDVAYRVLLQKDYPSWLYPVTLGATTMWERWNGWLPNKGFADSRMNSFNHYSFGAVGEYLFGMIGGIRETSPGFHTFQLAPVISDSLQWSACEFESIYGKISSKWTQNANELLLNVTIPANTNAEILIPTSSTANVFEENTLASKAVNVRFVSFENGKAKYRVESGKYSFKSLIIK
jgi:alpha-L-rhamnosidase